MAIKVILNLKQMTHHEVLTILRVRAEFEELKDQYDKKLNELSNLISECDHLMPDGTTAMELRITQISKNYVWAYTATTCRLCNKDEIPF